MADPRRQVGQRMIQPGLSGPKRGRSVRTLLPRGSLLVGAVLLGTLLVSGSAHAQSRRPVLAPGQQAPPAPPPPPPEAPVVQTPGTPDMPAPAARGPIGNKEPEQPKEPAAPIDFVDAGQLAGPAAAPAEEAIALPYKELRATRRSGDFVYVLTVRPGEPQAGDSVELFLRVNELLSIPDPAYGDRRPVEGGKLRVRVAGGGLDRSYQVHELDDTGAYGAHFTAAGTGVYKLELERLDGRRVQKLEYAIGVGVPTPGLLDATAIEKQRRSRNGITEGAEFVGVAGPNERDIAGVMNELGRRWMELERHAGSPLAAAAAAEVREQAAKVAGKMPAVGGGFEGEFDQLAAALVERSGGLEAQAADRGAVLSSMSRVQEEVCMRCHAKYRHQFAADVATWPNFGVKSDLQPAAPASNAAGNRTRTPFGAK